MRNDRKLRLRAALLTGACALFALGNAAHAQQAQDDDEDTFEQRVIKGILGGLGVNVGGAGIDYRERAPLVIPPSMDLPPPGSAKARDASWPKEPERKKVAVQAKVNRMATPQEPGTSSRMFPDELRQVPARSGGRITDPSQSGSQSDAEIGRPMSPKELNSSGIFNWKALTGNDGRETAKFEGEGPRGSLTQPPPGYQTPSPNQPYGAKDDTRGGWKIPTLLSRPEGSPDN